MKPTSEEFQSVLSAILSDSATPEDHERFADWVRNDASLRAEYIEQMQVHALLQWRHGVEHKGNTRPTSKPVGRARVLRATRWLLAASVLCVIGVAIYWRVSNREIARLESSENAVLAHGDLPLVGEKVVAGAYRLQEGTVRLQFASGTAVQIHAPAHFEVLAADRIRVHGGQLTARMDDGKSGFVVETPNARVVDEGTEFGVEVRDSGLTDVVVFQGKVALTPTRKEMLPLHQGEAVRVAAGGDVSRIVSVTREGPLAAWNTATADGLIASVQDNIRGLDSKKFYRIVRNGLREDAKAYVDRSHEWNSVTAGGMPIRLIGADYVMTFNDDKRKADLEVIVTLAKPCRLFVFFDDRVRSPREAQPPEWLRAQFVNTGEKIGLDEGPSKTQDLVTEPGAGNSVDRTFTIWERVVPEASSIKLGSNDRRAMYGIAAIPLE